MLPVKIQITEVAALYHQSVAIHAPQGSLRKRRTLTIFKMLATFSQILFFDAIVVFKNVIQISADILTSWRNSQNLNTFAIHSLLLSVYNVAIWSRFCTHATTSRSQEHCGIQHMCRCHVESAPTTKAFGGIKEKKKAPGIWLFVLGLFTPSVLEHLEMSVAFCQPVN